jgi:glutaredoxin 3
MTAKIVIYTAPHCSYCTWAKNLLDAKKLSYEEIRIDLDATQRAEMEKLSGRRTVPQIFINDQSIGGFDDLSALAQSGKLESLLKS